MALGIGMRDTRRHRHHQIGTGHHHGRRHQEMRKRQHDAAGRAQRRQRLVHHARHTAPAGHQRMVFGQEGIQRDLTAAQAARRTLVHTGRQRREHDQRGGAHAFPDAPDFFGEAALAGWCRVVEAVHGAGGRIVVQLWHCGPERRPGQPHDRQCRVSGRSSFGTRTCGFG
ncbi:hypothetical protein FOZ76_02785 [Verticiella sediminum]|uniref:Uncharacterized protein n=1 Tax=Verticiella sediminum TaxID=1247510 RepID=A0A556B0M9_9BURK|nr:hypothetical protein FOZ76_02785 [Verticiella sediminum]